MSNKVYELALKIAATLDSGYMKSINFVQRSLRSVEQQKITLDKVMAQRTSFDQASDSYKKAQAQLERLRQQLNQTQHPSAQLNREFKTAVTAAERASRAYQDQKEALDKLENSAKTAGKSLRALQAQERYLNKRIDLANRSEIVQQRQSAVTGRLMNGVGTMASIGGLAYSFAQPIQIGAEFESTMSRVAAVSGATSEELAKLSAQARELGATTVWSASDAAEGMTYLSMAGFNTQQMLKAMPGMLDLASAGAIDLATAADISSNILSGFGLEASEIGRVGDILTNTFTKSNTSMSTLGETMKYVAPIAASVGVNLETVSAMAGKLGDAGIQGSEAGTALRSVISRLVAPSAAGMEALNALGVSTTDTTGKLRAMPEILAELNQKMSKLPDNVRTAMTKSIFETEAMSAAFVLMEQAGSGAIDEMIKTVSRTGTAAEVAAKQNDNLIGDYKNLESAVEELSHILYDTFSPALREITQWLTEIATDVGDIINENKSLFKWLGIIGGSIVGVIAVLTTLGLAFNSVAFLGYQFISCAYRITNIVLIAGHYVSLLAGGFLKLIPVIFSAIKSFALFGATLLANPITWIVLGIGALITAGILLYKNWDTIKAKAAELWDAFKTNFPNVYGIVTSIFDEISSRVQAVKTTFGGLIDFITGVFTGNWEKAWNGLSDIVKGIFDLLPDFITKPIEFASNKITELVSKVKSWFGSDTDTNLKVVQEVNNQQGLINTAPVPQLATGGITTGPTLAMIGEGAEQEAVMPLSKLGSLLGLSSDPSNVSSNAVNVTFSPVINVNGSGQGDPYSQVKSALETGARDLRRQLEQLLSDRERLSYA